MKSEIEGLIKVEKKSRDQVWRTAFLLQIRDQLLYQTKPDLNVGPDGMPYLELSLSEPGTPTKFDEVLPECTDHLYCGIVVVSPGSEGRAVVQLVLSLGDLWSLRLNRPLRRDEEQVSDKNLLNSKVAIPTGEEAPTSLRNALGLFLGERYGVPYPSFCAFGDDSKMRLMMFNVTSTEFPEPEVLQAATKGIEWILPSGMLAISYDPAFKNQMSVLPVLEPNRQRNFNAFQKVVAFVLEKGCPCAFPRVIYLMTFDPEKEGVGFREIEFTQGFIQSFFYDDQAIFRRIDEKTFCCSRCESRYRIRNVEVNIHLQYWVCDLLENKAAALGAQVKIPMPLGGRVPGLTNQMENSRFAELFKNVSLNPEEFSDYMTMLS